MTPCSTPRFGQRLVGGRSRARRGWPGGREGGGAGGGRQEPGGRERAMVPPLLLFRSARQAIPGSAEAALWVDEVGEALQMDPKDFKEKYNEVKPSKSDSLVFSCLAGVRSKKALDMAMSLGFNSAQHYAGGWKEWATYEFSEKKHEN
ncbi:thiosulfate sulfurtransferase/rhodanese-like domain-containing protein 3 isoform X2 [Ailuropoda melanoleuca]|uniref:thiosulfate sulfurtransferase/rhodanese-like domain-containing protein 3 isoform X2 n=1 Tax=Ailuropoda melanoleuca TaxID=9646 RepID=UPI001493FB7C|nr:thiosulfate sulfurtransferase/rhodanese-like domain-containing protein 3 isoform X2 [Ailuropoda melanoleuca]